MGSLTAEQVTETLRRIAAWRLAPEQPVMCPVCETPALEIEDRSARPHAEWYVISCPACGLSETLQLPLGGLGQS